MRAGGGGEDVKGACKRAKWGRRKEAASKGGGVRSSCHPGTREPRASGLYSSFRGHTARPILAGGGAGGMDAAAPPPGATPPSPGKASAPAPTPTPWLGKLRTEDREM